MFRCFSFFFPIRFVEKNVFQAFEGGVASGFDSSPFVEVMPMDSGRLKG